MTSLSPALGEVGDTIAAAHLPSLDPHRPNLSLPAATADLTAVLALAGRAGEAVAELTRRIPASGDLTGLLADITTASRATELLTTAAAHLGRMAAVFATPASKRQEDELPVGVLSALARACLDDCAELLATHGPRAAPSPEQLRAVAATRRSPALLSPRSPGPHAPRAAVERSATVLPFRRRTP